MDRIHKAAVCGLWKVNHRKWTGEGNPNAKNDRNGCELSGWSVLLHLSWLKLQHIPSPRTVKSIKSEQVLRKTSSSGRRTRNRASCKTESLGSCGGWEWGSVFFFIESHHYYFLIILFIYFGHAGSLLLCGCFSSGKWGLLPRSMHGLLVEVAYRYRAQALGCMGSIVAARALVSVVVTRGFSCSLAWGIFQDPDQESNSSLLHWQVDSLPLSHQGSPSNFFLSTVCTLKQAPVLNLHSWAASKPRCTLNL